VRGNAAKRVYVVDDEPMVRTVLLKTLQRTGMTVRGFGSADECLACLNVEKCDLLITDVKMPGKDGIELLMEVKRRQPWLPVVVVTGFGDVPMAVRAMRAGATDFIEKPLDRDAFLDVVHAALTGGPQGRQQDYGLTRTERRILFYVLEGLNNREIADRLHRSHRTVEVHRGHLMKKMGANNIVELLRCASSLRLFGPGESPDAPSPTEEPAGDEPPASE
jgi:two-component system response regulator FixJ